MKREMKCGSGGGGLAALAVLRLLPLAALVSPAWLK